MTIVLFVCEMVWFSRTVLSPIYWVSPTIPIPARKRESYATLKLNLSRMLWLSKTLPTSEREGCQKCKKQKIKWNDPLSILCFFSSRFVFWLNGWTPPSPPILEENILTPGYLCCPKFWTQRVWNRGNREALVFYRQRPKRYSWFITF